jgi:hypothetical protein
MNQLEKKHKEFADPLMTEKTEEMGQSKLKQYQDYCRFKDKFELMPTIDTAEELYCYYKSQPLAKKKLQEEIRKDLQRSDPGNEDWKIDYKSGNNALYNVLAALANHDVEIGYAQGMNVVLSWILKFTRSATGEID